MAEIEQALIDLWPCEASVHNVAWPCLAAYVCSAAALLLYFLTVAVCSYIGAQGTGGWVMVSELDWRQSGIICMLQIQTKKVTV